MIALQIIFWVSFVSLAHTYLLYPLLLKILSVSPIRHFSDSTEETEKREKEEVPDISILISAYNEEKIIRQKLESIFNSDYPKEKIEVIVGSDASTDKTNEIVKSFSQVQLVEFKGRSGKPKIINELVKLAKNQILILTDANVIFDKNTICELTKHFSDSKIALVDSNMIHINKDAQAISKAESTYIRGEFGIKNDEGKVFGMMMGPFGGCYAVRKSFYTPVPENFLVDDFYINMKVLEKGGNAISELHAKVYEEVPTDWKIEFKRKIRIATGSFQNYIAFLHLIPKFNLLSFCFLSHKLIRWKGPFLMIGLYLSNFIISYKMTHAEYYLWVLSCLTVPPPTSLNIAIYFYLPFFRLQNFLVLVFIFDLILSALKISSPTRLITHFFTTNLALLIGFFKFLGGVKSSVWQPTKR